MDPAPALAPPDLAPDVLEAIASTCVTCWKADHPPPPASAIYLMDDWKWELVCQGRTHNRAVKLALDGGWQGRGTELNIAAHREMYARTGDDTHLDRMLRHVG